MPFGGLPAGRIIGILSVVGRGFALILAMRLASLTCQALLDHLCLDVRRDNSVTSIRPGVPGTAAIVTTNVLDSSSLSAFLTAIGLRPHLQFRFTMFVQDPSGHNNSLFGLTTMLYRTHSCSTYLSLPVVAPIVWRGSTIVRGTRKVMAKARVKK